MRRLLGDLDAQPPGAAGRTGFVLCLAALAWWEGRGGIEPPELGGAQMRNAQEGNQVLKITHWAELQEQVHGRAPTNELFYLTLVKDKDVFFDTHPQK